MNDLRLPKVWDEMAEKPIYLPAAIKTIEKIHDTNWCANLSKQDYYLLVYLKKGTGVFFVEGAEVNMLPHSVIIIKPERLHKFQAKSDSCEIVVLYFALKNKKNEINSYGDLVDFTEYVEDDENGDFLFLKLGRKNDIFHVMNRILRERVKYQVCGDSLSAVLVIELFVLLSRALKLEWEQSAKNRNLKLFELLNVAKEYIDKNYSHDLSLSQVAKYIYLSDSYFAHSFKNKFGISPKSYILKVRIDAAKELLENTAMKVSDVAASVGFSSQQRFNDIFRKHENITPLKYRQICKKARQEKENDKIHL